MKIMTGLFCASAMMLVSVALAAEPAGGEIKIPANTTLQLKVLETASSKISKSGDMFRLQVAAPLIVDGVTLVPLEAVAWGEVVHVEKSRMGGKAGELVISARYVEVGGKKIRLRSSFGAAGKDQTNTAMAVAIAAGGIPGLFIKGKETELAAGTLLSARVAEDTMVSVAAGYTAVTGAQAPQTQGVTQ